MRKDRPLTLRVRSEQLKKIKDLGFKYIDCWELGFERILENELEELRKLRTKYYNLYVHINTKIKNFGTKQDSEIKELDRLKDWYLKQNRSLDNPSAQDFDTLKFQMSKKKIETFTPEQVIDYWRNGK